MNNDRDDSSVEVGRCETAGCHRDAVMTFSFRDGGENRRQWDLCLPCRRVIDLARAVPWGDESDEWHDVEALEEFMEVRDVV